jgi:hypothetical protein
MHHGRTRLSKGPTDQSNCPNEQQKGLIKAPTIQRTRRNRCSPFVPVDSTLPPAQRKIDNTPGGNTSDFMKIDSTPSTRGSLKRRHNAHSDETPRIQNSINDHDVTAGEARQVLEVLLRAKRPNEEPERAAFHTRW